MVKEMLTRPTDKQLSDETRIIGQRWRFLKKYEKYLIQMTDSFEEQRWFRQLKEEDQNLLVALYSVTGEEKHTLAALREAQREQGDQKPLQTQWCKLSEHTKVGGMTWKSRKSTAMQEDYMTQKWFTELDTDTRQLIEVLRIT